MKIYMVSLLHRATINKQRRMTVATVVRPTLTCLLLHDNVHFNVSVTSRDLQTSRLALVSAIHVSCPSLCKYKWSKLASLQPSDRVIALKQQQNITTAGLYLEPANSRAEIEIRRKCGSLFVTG